MKIESGQGLKRQNKTTERMKQERNSPGATSAGGNGADAPDNDTSQDPTSSQSGGSLVASANTAARRGDMVESAGADDPQSPSTREERIRQAAYRIFEDRGGEPGDPTNDWLRAEAEVDAKEGNGQA